MLLFKNDIFNLLRYLYTFYFVFQLHRRLMKDKITRGGLINTEDLLAR